MNFSRTAVFIYYSKNQKTFELSTEFNRPPYTIVRYAPKNSSVALHSNQI